MPEMLCVGVFEAEDPEVGAGVCVVVCDGVPVGVWVWLGVPVPVPVCVGVCVCVPVPEPV